MTGSEECVQVRHWLFGVPADSPRCQLPGIAEAILPLYDITSHYTELCPTNRPDKKLAISTECVTTKEVYGAVNFALQKLRGAALWEKLPTKFPKFRSSSSSRSELLLLSPRKL